MRKNYIKRSYANEGKNETTRKVMKAKNYDAYMFTNRRGSEYSDEEIKTVERIP